MSRKKTLNPFYVLLVLVGTAFSLTASAYGVMTYRASQGVSAASEPHPLWALLDGYGVWLLMGELAALALFSFGAMATDHYWMQRAASAVRETSKSSSDS